MNTQPQTVQVKITSPAICSTHGWTPGGVYPTVPHPIEVPDKNGLQVYVESSNWKRPVHLSSSEYELVTPQGEA